MQGIKLVTFDATNTLLRFKIPPWEYYSVVGRDYGFVGNVDVLRAQMKDSFKLLNVKHPNFGRNDITWKNWWKEVVKLTFESQLPAGANIDSIANKLINEFRTTKCWDVATGTQKLLGLLKVKGKTVGVISNSDPRLMDILHNFSLYDNFNFILTSYDVGYSKPAIEIFNHALEVSKMSLRPTECLHIGDDYEKDYKGAKSAGWHALLVGSNTCKTSPNHAYSSIDALRVAFEHDKIEL